MNYDDDQRGPQQRQERQRPQSEVQGRGTEDAFEQRAYGRGDQQRRGHGGNGGGQGVHSVAEVALRGSAMLFDLQWALARNVWQTQARSATMLGAPDFSPMFEAGDERARRLFSTGAEQILDTVRHATEAMLAVQNELSRVAQQQAIGITDQVQQQLQALGRQTRRSLDELQQSTLQQATELARATREAHGRVQPQRDDASDAQHAWEGGGVDDGRRAGEGQQRSSPSAGPGDAERTIVVVGAESAEGTRSPTAGEGGERREKGRRGA
jgi:hypothetical protein